MPINDAYSKDVDRSGRLTAQQEREAGPEALVRCNLRLAIHVASWFGPPTDDVVQEANIGLMRAAQTYDPRRGRFSTWAVPVIQHTVATYLRRARTVTQVGGWETDEPPEPGETPPEAPDLEAMAEAQLAMLPSTGALAVRMRFGIGGGDVAGWDRIAQVIGMSRTGARKLVLRSLAMLANLNQGANDHGVSGNRRQGDLRQVGRGEGVRRDGAGRDREGVRSARRMQRARAS